MYMYISCIHAYMYLWPSGTCRWLRTAWGQSAASRGRSVAPPGRTAARGAGEAGTREAASPHSGPVPGTWNQRHREVHTYMFVSSISHYALYSSCAQENRVSLNIQCMLNNVLSTNDPSWHTCIILYWNGCMVIGWLGHHANIARVWLCKITTAHNYTYVHIHVRVCTGYVSYWQFPSCYMYIYI